MSLELFRTTNIDWLGKKWFFLGFSLIFSVAGVLSILFWHHIPLGVDFKGGTQIRVAFSQTPNEDQLRQAMDRAGVHNALIQRVSDPSGHAANKVIIALPESTDQSHDVGRQSVENALAANYHGSATVEQVEIVGPTAGKQLQKQAWLATMYSLIGMLIWSLQFDESGDNPYRNRSNPNIDWLFDERHHRRLRPYSRESGAFAERIASRCGQSEHQSDAEPDRHLVWANVFDRDVVISIWRRGVAWVFVRPCGWDFDWNVLVDCGSGTDAGGVPGLAGEAGQGRLAAGGKTG